MTEVSTIEPETARLSGLRVLIAHDWLVAWAGAERCLEQMLMVFPQADVVVGVMHPDMRALNAVTRRAQETWLARLPFARSHHRWFVPLEGAAFASLDTHSYDLVISSSHAFSKAVRVSGGTAHLCYCYSPPRYLWDLYDMYQTDARGLQRVALRLGVGALRRYDVRTARRVHHFVGISRCVANRIERWYDRSAEVLHPPVQAKPLVTAPPAREQFLLSLGRLVPYKRVELAIEAAEQLGVRLVVAGDGPERRRLEQRAGRWTEFVGEVDEQEAGRLMATCAAFVFCAEEDFGIAPVEANALGTPVVGFERAGLLDTMIDGVTVEFFQEQSVDAVRGAIVSALKRSWDVDALRSNAARFAPANFRGGLRRIAEGVVARHAGR